MKTIKITCTFLLMLCTLVTIGAKPAGYTINGTFTGLADGLVLELTPAGSHGEENPLASTTIMGGRFTFSGVVAEPRLFRITAKGYYGGALLMMDQTTPKVTISAEVTLAERYNNKYMDLKNIKIMGSPIHEQYLKKVDYRERLNEEHIAYNKRGEAIKLQVGAARKEKNQAKLDSLYKTLAYKTFEAEEKAFFDNVAKTSTNIIMEHKDSWWGAFLMLNAYAYFTAEQKPVFNSLSKTAQESYYGQKIKEELFPKGFIGEKAPTFQAATSDKKDAALAQLVKGNKYTLVDFWASWCQPCRKSIPALKSLYEEMNKKGLQIVSISIDKKEADWLKAEKEEQLKWPSYLDKGATSAAWKIRTIPAMFLLDEKGIVVAENVTIAQVKEMMK